MCHTFGMAEVQLMHAGEEGLILLIPLAIVLVADYRRRKRLKREVEAADAAASGPSGDAAPEPLPTDSD